MADDAGRRFGFESKLAAEADAVLTDTVFRRSPVLSKLLHYLVQETAAGRANTLKSYAVAVDGLGRPENFDATSDSSARVQMVRLRKALESHYAQHAPVDEQCLYLQPGSYKIRLGRLPVAYPTLYRPLSDAPTSAVAESRELPATPEIKVPPKRRLTLMTGGILIGIAAAIVGWFTWQKFGPGQVSNVSPILELLPVTNGDSPALTATASLVSTTFADDLPRFKISRIRIVTDGGPKRESSPSDRVYQLSSRLEEDDAGGSQKLFLNLNEARTGTSLWSREIALPADKNAAANALIPLLGEINGSFGVIAMYETILHQNNKSGGYPCLLKYFEFVRTREPAIEEKVAACFEKPVREHRIVSTTLAARALFAFERRSAATDFSAATRTGIKFARAAVAADPNDGSANFALARLSYIREDCVSARFYTTRAIDANPASPIIAATLAAMTAMAKDCQYPRADALLDQAFLAQSTEYSKGRLLLTLAALAQNKPEKLAEIKDSDLPQTTYNRTNYYLTETLIAASQGRRADARRNWALFSATMPISTAETDEKLSGIVTVPRMRQRLIRFLIDAGVVTQ